MTRDLIEKLLTKIMTGSKY